MSNRKIRDNLLIAMLFAASMLLMACSAPPRPRNLLVISLDTMRADRLPVYGFSGVSTPILDSLAAEGAVFDEAHAAVPLTLPSHANLFTGLYPTRLGLHDNAGAPLDRAFETLAESMRAHGLRTAAFVASSVLAADRGLDQGFQSYSLGSTEPCQGRRARRSADVVTDEALGWLAGDSAPFFAWVHFYDTHRPYRLPEKYRSGYQDPYLAAIAFEDEQIGRIVTYLRSKHELDDTLIVVVGDHGESLGDHGEDSHGIFLYQETLRVPLILRGAGIAPARIASPVRLVDVMPTVLALFGSSSRQSDGDSLVPLLHGQAEQSAREIYAESLYPLRFGWASLRSLRADRYKVIDAPRPELYDLATDPGEQRNLVSAKPLLAAAMLDRLRRLSDGGRGAVLPPVSDDRAAELASLGYVARGTDVPARLGAPGSDPKDQIKQFNRFTMLQASRAATSGPCRVSQALR
jgi:arylsulfatase A-like enzyme